MSTALKTLVAGATTASTLDGTEKLYGVQGGNDRSVTPAQLATFIAPTDAGGTVSGSDKLQAVQSGDKKQVTVDQVKTYLLPTTAAVALAQTDLVRMKQSGAGVEATVAQVRRAVLPAGVLLPYAGAEADGVPDGFLLCYGQEVSRTTYAALFTVIGTLYGTGNGTTTFNLPDLRGVVPIGKDDMGGSAASVVSDATTLGGVVGEATHQLTTNEIPHYTATDTPDNGSGNAIPKGSLTAATAHNNVQPSFVVNYIIST